jgi:hypothetical protein
MEIVCQINFNFMKWREEVLAERILRDFLLACCDQVKMTLISSSSVSLYITRRIHPKELSKFFSKNDLAEENSHFWIFNLTENVKNFINQATLFLNGRHNIFHGFSDPHFLKDGKAVGIMLGEKILNLRIPDIEKKELAEKGVYTDSPFI